MKIYLVGNLLLKEDSLPLQLKDYLIDKFPQFEFIEADPNENFIPEDDALIIDTVVGVDKIKLFDSLDEFTSHRLISPHDYDLGFHLQLLFKLKKIKHVKILGIPSGYPLAEAKLKVLDYLEQRIG
jgi:hypothetical protein